MKLLKMVMFAALAPTIALAEPPATDPSQPTAPTDESGGMAEHDAMSTGVQAFGLTAKPLSADKRSTYGGPKDAGLLVTKVESGSPADSAGIKAGDVITKIDDTPLATTDDLTKAWKQDQSAQKSTAAVEVVRNHETKNVQISLGADAKSGQQQQQQPNQDMPKGGY